MLWERCVQPRAARRNGVEKNSDENGEEKNRAEKERTCIDWKRNCRERRGDAQIRNGNAK